MAIIFCPASVLAQAGPAAAASPALQAGQKIVFYNDSVLQLGWDRPNGFVSLIAAACSDQDRSVAVVKAGVGATVSADLLARLKKEVLDQKPDWLTLSCGGNDVARNVPLDRFEANVTAIADQAGAAGIRIVIVTAPMMGEDQASPNNQKLILYNDFLRGLAKERSLPLADLNADMQAAIAQVRGQLHLANPGNLLTIDGAHLNGLGEEMVAGEILTAFGFTAAQMAEARDIWLDLPGGMDLLAHNGVSVRQYLQLRDLAATQGIGADEMLNRALGKDVQGMLTSLGHAPPHKKSHAKKKTAMAAPAVPSPSP